MNTSEIAGWGGDSDPGAGPGGMAGAGINWGDQERDLFQGGYGQPAGPGGKPGESPQAQAAAATRGLSPAQALELFGNDADMSLYGKPEPLSLMQEINNFLQSPGGRLARGTLATALGPLGWGLNAVYNFATAEDKVGAALNSIPGPAGLIAGTGYGMYNSDDPGGYLGGRVGSLMAGYMGNQIAGPYGGQLAVSGLQSLLEANRERGPQGTALASLSQLGNNGGQGWEDMLSQNYGPPQGMERL